MDTPGPGSYENVLALNTAGRYPATYVPNTATRRITDIHTPTQSLNVPGPGAYQAPSDFGIYISSRFLRELKESHLKIKLQRAA